MSEDPLSPRPIPPTLTERLAKTGNKIAELSKQAASSTKEAVTKVAGAGKEAAAKTSQAVSDAKESRREKKEDKLNQIIQETRAELKEEGHIQSTPEMITLPEFEEERMALMAEEHDILVDLVNQMHGLSERIDQLERTYKALALEDKGHVVAKEKNSSSNQASVLKMLLVSVCWVAILIGLDQALSKSSTLFLSTYPAEIFSWAIGTGLWIVYLLSRIGKSAPIFKPNRSTMIQFGLFTGIISMFLLLLSDDNIATMSTFYVLGLGIAMVVLFTSRLVSDESEVIG